MRLIDLICAPQSATPSGGDLGQNEGLFVSSLKERGRVNGGLRVLAGVLGARD
ncbi:MAG: hypothetical protein ACLQI7_04935 [Streptosporangiaceae bacterium]